MNDEPYLELQVRVIVLLEIRKSPFIMELSEKQRKRLYMILYMFSIALLGIINLGAYLESIQIEESLRNKILLFTFFGITIFGTIIGNKLESYFEK